MANSETNRIEYKEKLTDDLEKEVVAFLNSDGGKIYIGIRDDGTIAGVQSPDKTQLKITDRLKNNITPSIMGLFDIFVETHDDKTVVVVNLAGGEEKPYCVKQKGYSESGCFIRVGSSSQPMPQRMIDRFLAKRNHLSIANMASRHQDLEFNQLKLYYGLKGKPLNDNFAKTLDFLTPEGKYNLVAFLFADNNNISVRLGKYSGTNRSDLIGREDYKDCCLITAMQKMIDRLDAENITQSRMRPMQSRLDKKLIDEDVFHEAIINAFAHNDYSQLDTPIFYIYSDRFEVVSYGGLVDDLPLEEFYSGQSKPRNREIMRIFKDLELVEQLGNGVTKIVRKYGRKVYDIHENSILTTIKFDRNMRETVEKVVEKTVKKTVEKILKSIKEQPHLTIEELAKSLAIGTTTVSRNLKKLKTEGKIRRVGSDKGGHWEIIE